MTNLPTSILIGSDHAGYKLKEELKVHLQINYPTIKVQDYGTDNGNKCDYPDIAQRVCNDLLQQEDAKGILICGSGIGISIAANKISGIRAALCHNEYCAEMARKHNDANVLVMGERIVEPEMATKILDAYFKHEFEGNQHKRRVDKIHLLE